MGGNKLYASSNGRVDGYGLRKFFHRKQKAPATPLRPIADRESPVQHLDDVDGVLQSQTWESKRSVTYEVRALFGPK